MVESLTAMVAAVISAPILKLCPANLSAGRLAIFKMSCSSDINLVLIRVLPLHFRHKSCYSYGTTIAPPNRGPEKMVI